MSNKDGSNGSGSDVLSSIAVTQGNTAQEVVPV